MTDTIYALATAPGRAGVAVVRLSGSGAAIALRDLAGSLPLPRQAH
jgi:tRNA modification GTPase